MSLFASVNRGYSPVIGAKVKATIEYPNGGVNTKTNQLEMRDDGAGADIEKGDGIYSAYIVNSHVRGKHTISIDVENGDDTNVKTVKTYSSSAGGIAGWWACLVYVACRPSNSKKGFMCE